MKAHSSNVFTPQLLHAQISQKHKMLLALTVFFALLGYEGVKTAHKMLDLHFINIRSRTQDEKLFFGQWHLANGAQIWRTAL